MAETIGKGVMQVGFDRAQIEQAGREELLPSARRLAADLASTFAAVKILDVAKSGIADVKEAQQITAATTVLLRDQGAQAGVTAEEIDGLKGSMAQLSIFDDEAAKSAANVLLRFEAFKGIDGLKRVEGDAADLAVVMSSAEGGTVNLASAADLLGRALQAPDKASRLLRPAIGALNDAQLQTIKAFEDAGDAADAQNVILDLVEQKVSGAAKQYSDTLPGSIDKASASWKEAKESLASGFAPALEAGAGVAQKFADVIAGAPTAVQGLVGGVVLAGGATAALIRPVADLGRAYEVWASRSKAAKTATEAITVAELAEADAQTVDAAATGANAAAHEAGALAGGKLSSALGKAGVTAAVLATVVALGEYGNSLNKTTASTEEVVALTKLSADEVNKALDAWLSLNHGAFGGMGDSFLKGLADQGTAGIGVLRQYRDHLVATGQDVSKVDAVLQGAADAQSNFNANQQRGTADADAHGQALLELATAENVAAQSAKDLAAAQQADNQERATRLSSVTGLFQANQSLVSAQQQLTQAERGETDAARGLEDAHRRVTDAERSRADAVDRLTDAEEALKKAQQPADEETLGKAQLDLTDAHNRVGDAQSAVTAAEAEAAKERRDGQHTAADVADADRKVEEAKNNLQRAVYAEHDAEVALQKVQAKGTDQDQAVVDAKKAVDDATRGVQDANQRLTDSYQGVTDAQQRIVDAKASVEGAYLGIAAASAGVKDAQNKLYSGTSDATTALFNQDSAFEAIEGRLDPSSPFRKNISDYIGDLAVLRDIFAMDSSVPTEDILNRHVGAGQPSARAAGGPVAPMSPYLVGEHGPELFIPDVAGHITPNNQIVPNSQITAGSDWRGRSGIHVDKIEVVNPSQEPASSSVIRELSILSDKMALVS